MDYDDDIDDDLKSDYQQEKPYRCSDGMCGCYDCTRCNPSGE